MKNSVFYIGRLKFDSNKIIYIYVINKLSVSLTEKFLYFINSILNSILSETFLFIEHLLISFTVFISWTCNTKTFF